MTLPADVEARRRAARQLLLEAAGQGSASDVIAAAAAELLEKLCQRLALLIGSSGASALLERAMGEVTVLAPRSGSRSRQPRSAELLNQLRESLSTIEPEEARAAVASVFDEFAKILGRFVGQGFATRVLHDLWPQFFPERNARS